MQQKIHPGIAFGVILVVIGIVSFVLWYPNRARPVPDHFGPVSLGQAQAMQMHGGSAAQPVTAPSSSGMKASAHPHGSPADAKDNKSADGK